MHEKELNPWISPHFSSCHHVDDSPQSNPWKEKEENHMKQRMGGNITLEASLPDGGYTNVLLMRYIISCPVHLEFWIESSHQAYECIHLHRYYRICILQKNLSPSIYKSLLVEMRKRAR